MWKYLWTAQNRHRDSIFQILERLSPDILRTRSSEKGWSIEEIIRHIISAEEFWIRRVVLNDADTAYHPVGVENDMQAEVWLSLKEIRKGWNDVDQLVYELIARTIDFEKVY
ncbi:MAG: DinB family protein, partial [Candidatus Hodarchaeota archaeon]